MKEHETSLSLMCKAAIPHISMGKHTYTQDYHNPLSRTRNVPRVNYIRVIPFQINTKNGARSQIFSKLGVHVRHVKLWLGHAFKGHILYGFVFV